MDLRRLAPLLACILAAPLACADEFVEGESESFTAGFGLATSDSSGELDSSTSSSGGATSATSGATSTTSTSTSGATSTTSAGSTTDDPELTTGDASTTGDATTGGVDGCPRVRVDLQPGDVLNVRPAPATDNAPIGTLPAGAIVDVLDLVTGEALDGNDEWFEIAGLGLQGYVWSGLVECTTDEPPEPPDGFLLPLECGMSAKVTQGNFGQYSHQGQSAYAFDFSLGVGTPLVAIADGSVFYIYDKTKPGDPCYNGGDQSCINKANVVVLLHGDDTMSIYAHLSEVEVGVGDVVLRGEAVGLSGSTGYSTGRHAHVARQENCGGSWCQSIAVAFEDVPGDGVPKTGDTVTSMNCP
ncbi:MAG: peptidoglycan DD-metalloendopeptidase family protein [Myxococcales bacterium]|nr:peptidoglycan DD-metalloendopeptidase family protein [Myxococcales bacterium]